MKTLKQIIDEVKIDLKQFTDDNRINYLDTYIQEKCDDIRATLIRQDVDSRKGYASMDFYQPICCIEVECLEQGCIIDGETIKSGTVLWKAEMPPLIEDVREYDLKFLGTDNYQNAFHRVSLSGLRDIEGDIWNKNSVSYTKIGSTVYLKHLPTSGIKFICAVGLWQSPTKLCDYSLMTTLYPVPSDYQLKILLKRDILTSWGYIYEDKQSNVRDDSIIPPAAVKANAQSPTEEKSSNE